MYCFLKTMRYFRKGVLEMKIMLTGFEPFLNFEHNPTEKIIRALHHTTRQNVTIEGVVLPVKFEGARKHLKEQLAAIQPDAIVSLGLAAGRNNVTPERIALNIQQSSRPDNDGHVATGQAIDRHGEASLFSTLPIDAMVEALVKEGYPASISNTAGTYVCNAVMYEGLQYADKHKLFSGFIHIPADFELAIAHGNLPSWNSTDLLAAVTVCLDVLIDKMIKE